MIYHVANKNGITETALEMIRHRANSNNRNLDVLEMLDARINEFDVTPDAQQTKTFIAFAKNYYYVHYADENTRRNCFEEQLQKVSVNPPDNLYESIELLHAVCMYISLEAKGDLLVEYIDRLGTLINKLPEDNVELRNAYTVQAAIAYAAAGNTQKAVDADLKLIDIMDSLRNYYRTNGRPYRAYGANRYIVYTRLLGNWEHLADKDISKYYEMAMRYAVDDPRAAATYAKAPLPDIFYSMATKDYAKASKLIQKYVDEPLLSNRRSVLLRYLIIASDALGDKDTMLYASREYNNMLEQAIDNRMKESYKELQIIYDTYGFKQEYESLRSEKSEGESKIQRIIIVVGSVALLVLLILVYILIKLYRRSHRLSETLQSTNKTLESERDSLRTSHESLVRARDAAMQSNQFKTDYIRNMSNEVTVPLNAIVEYSHLIVDCTDANDKPYLERYAEQVESNCAFLTAIVNDVLHLSEIDSDQVSLRRELVDLRKIAEISVETIRPMVHNGVEIIFDTESPNPVTYTDPRRVQQILVNVIGNAAKYTRRGHICLECNIVNDGKSVAIAISDTGPGIPCDEKDHVFDRFVKLDKNAQGIGLGLSISRLLARLLGGDLILDTTYTRGARFIFTIPYLDR
ncbi:MAG: HAMP domain-containing histidine kinase [Muribaculaceae bacterium]|nr:HAMP domain-containing histidine kinase [Muribaculaceae bacterium]